MNEHKIGAATVRIHGTADPEKVKAAAEKFLKRVVQHEKKKQKANRA